MDILLDRFQGDFDNYAQVIADRERGWLPREGGGHEHIHCTLIPLSKSSSKNSRLAAFYFNGNPNAIFRFRFYKLEESSSSDREETVDTILYTLHPKLEAQLRATPNPLEWPHVFDSFDEILNNDESNNNDDDDDDDDSGNSDQRIILLPKCQIRWSRTLDPVQHEYALRREKEANKAATTASESTPSAGMHAIMVHGEAVVDSQMIPGQKILIRDQLSLWSDALWIHDRGYEPDTMEFIYGNQQGIPYQLDRVTDVRFADDDNDDDATEDREERTRTVVDDGMAWTLGPNHRTEAEYAAKLEAVGAAVVKQQ